MEALRPVRWLVGRALDVVLVVGCGVGAIGACVFLLLLEVHPDAEKRRERGQERR